MLPTPCRRVGLNRKRKNIISGLSGSSTELNISSPNNSLTEIDISVKENNFTPETNKIHIETPVLTKNIKPRKGSLGARKRTNHSPITNDVILSPEQVKKYKLINNINSDIKIVLTRCDFDEHILNRNNVREPSADILMRIENEAISSTPLEAKNSEIQTNQISTTITDATPADNNSISKSDVTEKNLEHDKVSNKSTTSKKFRDLFGDNSDDSDFESSLKQTKRKQFSLKTSTKTNKKNTSIINEDTNDESTQNSLDGTDTEMSKNQTEKKSKPDENIDKKIKSTNKSNKNSEDTNEPLNETNPDITKTKTKHTRKEKLKSKIHKRDTDSQSQNDSDEITEFNVSRKKRKRSSSSHSKKSPKINKKEITPKPRVYNSDSDDDFMEKPRREKKDPDIKKKINIPAPDPLNRIEHIRIRENKSYTIMHMNNISSYVKYYDNDVNLKRTESDDNQQTTSQPIVSNVKTSMILERKSYLNNGSQETNHSSETNSEPTNVNSDSNENSEPTNVNSDGNKNTEPTNLNSDCNKDSESTNLNSNCNQYPELSNVNSDGNENPESTNIVSDCIENPEINRTSDITKLNKNLECNTVVRDSIENTEANEINDSFAGFRPESVNRNSIENPVSNINIFSVENDIENSNSNDLSNFNDVEKPDSNDTIETPEVCNVERPETVKDSENRETVSDDENLDDPQNEMKKMLKLKSNLITQIKMKRDKLDSLKRIMAYKEEHNLDDLTKTTLQFKYTLQEALIDLLSHLKTHTERNFNMLLLLGFLKIPSEMVGYNDETKSFE